MPDETQNATPYSLFEIKTSHGDDATTIALSGELDLATVDQLNDAIRQAENSGPGAIVIDLEKLAFMDSAVLSALLEARKRARANNHQLRFIPSSDEQISQVLSLTDTEDALFSESSEG